MAYKVVRCFADREDANHVYMVGDEYPRHGFTASKERIEELSTDANNQNTPLIAEIAGEVKADDNSGTASRNPRRFNSRIAK